MEHEEIGTTPASSQEVQPDNLLKEFRKHNEALDGRLDTLQELVELIRNDIHHTAEKSLGQLAQAAQDMANGRVFQQIDIQAKGELGALVASINTTLSNIQLLDSSVKQQSTQVPELAAQLDAITADTEVATQNVMNRLDTLMAASDQASSALKTAQKALGEQIAARTLYRSQVDALLARAGEGTEPTQLAQEVLEFLFAHHMTPAPPAVNLEACAGSLNEVSNEAFEILNTMQFQDITRQKVEKVVLLLKQFKEGLNRLLEIFHINETDGKPVEPEADVFAHRTVATQDRIFDTSLSADGTKESVEDIIAQFKKAKT